MLKNCKQLINLMQSEFRVQLYLQYLQTDFNLITEIQFAYEKKKWSAKDHRHDSSVKSLNSSPISNLI